MRITALLVLCFFSFQSFGQCVDCTSIQEALKNPEMVKTLKINSWIHDTKLNSIPKSIDKLINVELIYLTDHDITKLPRSINKLSKLKELSLAGCKLESLPEEVFELKNLSLLILLYNKFSNESIITLQKKVKDKMPQTKLLINKVKKKEKQDEEIKHE